MEAATVVAMAAVMATEDVGATVTHVETIATIYTECQLIWCPILIIFLSPPDLTLQLACTLILHRIPGSETRPMTT